MPTSSARRPQAKNVSLDLDRAARARRGGARRSRPGSTSFGGSATRSAPASRPPIRRSGRRSAPGPRPSAPRPARPKPRWPSEQAELEALMLRLPEHSLGRRAGRSGRELQHGRADRRRAAELRFRAARPCRAGRDERLGRPVADHPGRRLAHVRAQGPARPARAGPDVLGPADARRRRLHPDDGAGAGQAAGLRRHRPFPRPRGRSL